MKDRGRENDGRQMERNRDFLERTSLSRVFHDAGEFGEENVQEIDEEWAEFERVLRFVMECSTLNFLVEIFNVKIILNFFRSNFVKNSKIKSNGFLLTENSKLCNY